MTTNPWDRQPQETNKAWQAFMLYRDAPLDKRSHQLVATQLGKDRALISRWSARWDWVARVEAWETAQDQAFTAEILHARRKVMGQQLREMRALKAQALQAMQAQSATLQGMVPRDILAFMIQAAKHEADLMGLLRPEVDDFDGPAVQGGFRVSIDARLLPPVRELTEGEPG